MKRYSPAEITQIRKHLRSLLPTEAFAATPAKLIPIAVHIAITLACFAGIGATKSPWLRAPLAIVAGHSLAVIAIFGHHLSHHAFVRQRHVLVVVEYVVWTITGTPPTIWRKIHNQVHHRNTQALSDAFRYFSDSERGVVRSVYSALFIPNRYNWFNPLVFLTPMVLHILHGTAAVVMPRAQKRSVITNLGEYSGRERLMILVDLALIIGFQTFVRHISGGFEGYLWSGFVAMMAGTMVAGTYVYSQHSLHPLTDHDDPFASTSLKMPAFMHWLHLNVGHHTAHHLFEGMNTDYLPRVTELLREHYPDALDERGPLECWRAIFKNGMYKANPPALQVSPSATLAPELV